MEPVYTVDQAADRLRLHVKTVLRLIRDGRLRATRIGKAYRILQSDLEGFAGVPRRQAAAAAPRATCVVDCSDIPLDVSGRIAALLNAAVTSDVARPTPIQLTTAYDPERKTLKVVIIAAPLDAAALLRTLSLATELRP